ncbi:DUF692 domain-containing protein [Permianibacter sp. IMCC34836]|uniref:MNIO family bufferin maturase n=1 Tax=Permianibacter fluminis TaxID=2738515 RepID=UPI001557D1BC|nr:DUF692 domain-containing protein [Permianibacter fluminis]NQD37984.1 DUF692 domain-containing protein [Permianibacter fluminis]
MAESVPFYGYGLGLRPPYVDDILNGEHAIDWFEILTENYLVPGGKPLAVLSRIRQRYPVAMHGVSLSIGGSAPLNTDYLQKLKALADRIEPMWVSDHLCWTGHGGSNTHDLLPLPYTKAAAQHIAERIQHVQDVLGRRILIENVSSYAAFQQSEMTEWEFLSEVVTAADCWLLFDINNVYVSSVNHQFDPLDFIRGVPAARVKQFHLAGHSDYGDYLIDTHDHAICDPVWQLYREAWRTFGPVSTMIERDDEFPPFADLMAELQMARDIGESLRREAA